MTAAPPPADPTFWQWLYDNVWAPIGGTTVGAVLVTFWRGTLGRIKRLEETRLRRDEFEDYKTQNGDMHKSIADRAEQERRETRENFQNVNAKLDALGRQHQETTVKLLEAIHATAERRHQPRE